MTETEYLGETPVTDLTGTPYEGFGAVEWALDYIDSYAQIDGEHHKQWTLDQVARILTGSPVTVELASWSNGQQEYRTDVGEPTDYYRAWVDNWNAGRRSVRSGESAALPWLALEFMLIHGRSVGDGWRTLDTRSSNVLLHRYSEHKQWMLDCVAKILHGTPVLSLERAFLGEPTASYLAWVEAHKGEEDEDGERMYGYEEGAPLSDLAETPRGVYDAGIAP